jgi:putative copper resistance protein D
VVFFAWAGSEERRGRRDDRMADRDNGAELAAYNARLRAMAAHNRG